MYQNKKVAVVIPALNEEMSIGAVVSSLKSLRTEESRLPLIDDIVVCNNGSTDTTEEKAKAAGARCVTESEPGYGIACLTAIAALNKPDIVIFVDADSSVITAEVDILLEQIGQKADLVIGSRTLGTQQYGAMTFQQQFGNWLASKLIQHLWKHPITDLGPFRAICYRSLVNLNMQDRRFGWTVEMQVKAIQHKMKVVEVPVSTNKRIGRSKISGTISGTIGAAIGIFSMIFRLRAQEQQSVCNASKKSETNNSRPLS